MTAINLSLAPDNSSAALFRAWGSAVDGTFGTCGWVQTSDTGQINWVTVGAPGGANTAMGYSIWRMNDTLQSTKPVFIKMEYGSGTATGSPCFWITIGTGSDGAGNITGILKSRGQFGVYSTAIASPCNFSGANNRYCFSLWHNSGISYQWLFLSIERTHDTNGADNSTGLMFFAATQSNGTVPGYSAYLPFTGTVPSAYSAWNCNIPTTNVLETSGSYKNTVAVYPVKCWTPGESGPSSNFVLYQINDITPNINLNTISLSLFDANVTATYYPLLFTSASSCFNIATHNRGTSGAAISLALRYD